ncbi:hypothetical protein E2C01_057179 [Portunus trituberculatus]|uniref:Uncharacterized protein n=1 Tax=Portunus trituberculatus TaxID=210409 RepID=A0A5B7GZT5_PORTR|nr:hypothetical protein [Portunus trituberculatus]
MTVFTKTLRGKAKVSWLRRDNDHLELLTWADNTYTNDDRWFLSFSQVLRGAGGGGRLAAVET